VQINGKVTCELAQLDLSSHSGVEAFANDVVRQKVCIHSFYVNFCWTHVACLQLESAAFSNAVFISNAGTLHPLGRFDCIASKVSLAELSRQIDINLTSHLWLSSFVAAAFQQQISNEAVIVNVSSLAAIQALPTWGAYCSHKAARDMGLATAAAEGAAASASCSLAYLNWAPGPMDGNMQTVIRTDPAVDPSLRDWSSKALADGELVPMQHSADALAVLLAQPPQDRTWTSGAHVDFFDEPVQAAWKAASAS